MISESPLRLGFYYHVPVLWEGESVRLPGFLGRFIDGLAVHSGQLTCFFHEAESSDNRSICDYIPHSTNLTWINLGPPRSALFCSFFPHPILRRFKAYRNQLDALLIRGPSPLLPSLACAAKKIPIILLLVGDYRESSAELLQPAWRKLLIRAWANWYTGQQLQIARHNLTLVNSRRLYHQLEPYVPDLFEIRTTTLESADFYERLDTCQHRPIHLLYTGRFSASKGLFDIVEALAQLVGQNEDIMLDLVGWPEKGEGDIIERLLTAAKEKGISGRIVNHGYHPVGPDLFSFYRRADIYILASRSSFEGFPRTIWEAMANSLPVIATRVGSIPDYLRDHNNAMIVSPKSPQELKNAIESIVENSALRRKLIQNGFILAKENQVDNRSIEIIQHIKTWLSIGFKK